MHVGSVGTLPTLLPAETLAAATTGVLKDAVDTQAQMVETLLAISLENTVAVQKMQIAGQIIDAYA